MAHEGHCTGVVPTPPQLPFMSDNCFLLFITKEDSVWSIILSSMHFPFRMNKIMVLDDDLDIAELVKMSLQRNGFNNVFVFTHPSLALEDFGKITTIILLLYLISECLV